MKTKKIILSISFIFITVFLLGIFVVLFQFEQGKNKTILKESIDFPAKNENKKEPSKIEQPKPKVSREIVKIGFITDAHCYANNSKNTNYKWKLNWRCTEPLEAFAKKMNEEFKPDFVINGGDFIDGKDKRKKETFIESNEIFNTIESPRYHVLGNHEMKEMTKDEWLELVDFDEAYYYFDLKGYRFIVLDGNYRKKDGTIEHTRDGALTYAGFVGGEQLDWLKETLLSSNEKGLTNVVFVHQPPVGNDSIDISKVFANGKEIQKILANNNVLAVFSGHIERMCNIDLLGVEYFVLQGFARGNKHLKEVHRYRNGGVYSEIILNPDNEIKVEMFYRKNGFKAYESVLVNKDTANCLDGKMLEQDEYDSD